MDISNMPNLSKKHFTLTELEEMNRDMESVIRLSDSIFTPPKRKQKPVSNVYLLRPDITIPR